MLAGIVILLGLSFLVVVHELGHFIAAKRAGLLVEEFGVGFPPRMYAKKIGETEYSINWLPFGGFVRVHGERTSEFEGGERGEKPLIKERALIHQSVWTRFVIVGAGVAINFLVGWFLLSAVFLSGSEQFVMISTLVPDTPAAEVGILEGDRLPDFASSDMFVSYIQENKGSEVTLNLLREGEAFSVAVTPRVDPPPSEGSLGVAVSDMGFARLGFFESITEGLRVAVLSTGEIFYAVIGIFTDIATTATIDEGVVGPIGILSVASQLNQIGFIYVIQLIALISLNLAVLNILPFPALDGGRMLFLIIEAVKGGPIGHKKEMIANIVSFVLLFLLMIVITARDVMNLF